MKNIRVFLSENFQFLEVKFSIYLNRRVFVMDAKLIISSFDKRGDSHEYPQGMFWCKYNNFLQRNS